MCSEWNIDNWNWRCAVNGTEENILQAQWDALPNYVEEGTNAIIMADTSGSMNGRPICTALGLAIYFAQRNVGAYHDLFMTFSKHPKYQKIKGKTLKQILSNLNYVDEMPKSLIIISDMEFDWCGGQNWSFYEEMRARFAQYGYEIPTVIFWQAESRHDVFHADKDRKGVILVSGQSAGTFKNLIGAIGMTPSQYMLKILNSIRYEVIRIE